MYVCCEIKKGKEYMYQDLYHPFPCFCFFCCLIFQTWCYVILKTLLVASLCCIVVTVKIPLFEANMHGSLYLWYSFVYVRKPILKPILLSWSYSFSMCRQHRTGPWEHRLRWYGDFLRWCRRGWLDLCSGRHVNDPRLPSVEHWEAVAAK